MKKGKGTTSVDPAKYVVLDVETNGLASLKHDLLSISIYRPDTGEMYNRFLPLELNTSVLTTEINGITAKDLKGLFPLTQAEVDEIIRVFELKERTILTYGSIDEKFMVKYFQRHHLQGIDYFAFYNFKHEIISSKFSEGNITKDNLCNLYGIENVQSVHSGSNDCVLEWQLFERMNGHRLLITNNSVFEFNDEYIVPASYITTYPNFKYYLPAMPKITCESRVVFSLPITADKLRKFPTNFNGMIVEHLINSMLHVQKVDSTKELLENKKKLNYLGKLPSVIDIVPMVFNPDGSMTATRQQDKKLAKDINAVIKNLKSMLGPLLDYIAMEVFKGKMVKSQELMVHPERKVLALCDLSSEDAVLEIKTTTSANVQSYAEQLYYEAAGRKCFVLQTDWSLFPKMLAYVVYEVQFTVQEYVAPQVARFEKAKQKIENEDIALITFTDAKTPVKLKCKKCGNEWSMSYNLAIKHRPCPECEAKTLKSPRVRHRLVLSEEERLTELERTLVEKSSRFHRKLDERSGHQLVAMSFKDSRSPARVKCQICGHEWEARADHLLDRPYCPVCKRKQNQYIGVDH
jgi:DNA polymerase III epsilon subunit-like protein/rubrerythrin